MLIPQLVKIRTAFRTVLDLAITDRLRELLELLDSSIISEQEKAQIRLEYNSLRISCQTSILHCSGTCKDFLFKDMVYSDITKSWFCKECYSEIIEGDGSWGFNNGNIITKKYSKPCLALKYCPYGYLVESFSTRLIPQEATCEIFGHDCPVYYLPIDCIENSRIIPTNEKFPIELFKHIRIRQRKNYLRYLKEKPCKKLEYCPYGFLTLKMKKKKDLETLNCKLFNRPCPIFFLKENI